jgi:hypothetical protein
MVDDFLMKRSSGLNEIKGMKFWIAVNSGWVIVSRSSGYSKDKFNIPEVIPDSCQPFSMCDSAVLIAKSLSFETFA